MKKDWKRGGIGHYWKRYKEKKCPKCGKLHRNNGQYCSKPCSNSHRNISESHRINQRNAMKKYFNKPESIAHKQQVINRNKGEKYQKLIDIDIAIPIIDFDILDF